MHIHMQILIYLHIHTNINKHKHCLSHTLTVKQSHPHSTNKQNTFYTQNTTLKIATTPGLQNTATTHSMHTQTNTNTHIYKHSHIQIHTLYIQTFTNKYKHIYT